MVTFVRRPLGCPILACSLCGPRPLYATKLNAVLVDGGAQGDMVPQHVVKALRSRTVPSDGRLLKIAVFKTVLASVPRNQKKKKKAFSWNCG